MGKHLRLAGKSLKIFSLDCSKSFNCDSDNDTLDCLRLRVMRISTDYIQRKHALNHDK